VPKTALPEIGVAMVERTRTGDLLITKRKDPAIPAQTNQNNPTIPETFSDTTGIVLYNAGCCSRTKPAQ